MGKTRFIWFGTDKVYDAFTFIFQESEYGLFQVHAYPFDATMGTFIVECAEETWQRAGLTETDEAASVAFCEALFARPSRRAASPLESLALAEVPHAEECALVPREYRPAR